MKIRFNKNHLDFKQGKEYEVIDPTAVYLVRLGVAKEVVEKGKIKELKAPVTTKELKTTSKTK